MRYLSFLAMALFAGAALADDVVQAQSLQVQESLEAIELINVTADKPLDEAATAEADEAVSAILAAAEAAED